MLQVPLLYKYKGLETIPSKLPIIPNITTVLKMGIIGSWEGYVSSPLYLFNNGSWNGLQTTGMLGSTQSGSELIFPAGTLGRLNQTVDLTRYNYIKINSMNEDGSYGVMDIGISTDPNIKTISSSNCVAYVTARNGVKGSTYFIAILDVSSIIGFYYIYTKSRAYMSGGGGVYVNTYPGRINQMYLTVN